MCAYIISFYRLIKSFALYSFRFHLISIKKFASQSIQGQIAHANYCFCVIKSQFISHGIESAILQPNNRGISKLIYVPVESYVKRRILYLITPKQILVLSYSYPDQRAHIYVHLRARHVVATFGIAV